MTPFTVRWTRKETERLRAAVRAYRFPDAPPGAGWRYGCDPAFLRALCDRWACGFDFEAAQAALNRFPQVLHTVEGLPLHAVHLVGEANGRRPLLLVHGWPNTAAAFFEVAERLAFPSRFGGSPEDAFDPVIPSLPGFGFSGRPRTPTGPRGTARLFHALMRDGFGYTRFRVHGGDWGAAVGAWLALDFPEVVAGLHLASVLVHPGGEPGTPEEAAWRNARSAAEHRLGGYQVLQRTRPLSLAYAAAGNPVAQAAWIVERLHDWADLRARPFEAVFPPDRILPDLTTYALTGTFGSAAFFYAGADEEWAGTMPAEQRVEVPTSVLSHPDPRAPFPPRSWVERGYNVRRWTALDRGGHFLPMEEPEALAADLTKWGRLP